MGNGTGEIAWVVGATGLIGRELVQLLLKDKDYSKVIILVRTELPIQHEKPGQRIIDFERIEQYVSDPMQDTVVFCTLGTTMKKAGSKEAFRKVDYDYPWRLAQICANGGARQFSIVTALGSNPSSTFFYSRVKGELEEALKGLKLQSLHIFRPSLLLGNRAEVRFGEQLAARLATKTAFIWKGPLVAYKPIHVKTVAEAMIGLSKKTDYGVFTHGSSDIPRLAEAYTRHEHN